MKAWTWSRSCFRTAPKSSAPCSDTEPSASSTRVITKLERKPASGKASQVRRGKLAACSTVDPKTSTFPGGGKRQRSIKRGKASHEVAELHRFRGVGAKAAASRPQNLFMSTSMQTQGMPREVAAASAAENSPPTSTPANWMMPYRMPMPESRRPEDWHSRRQSVRRGYVSSRTVNSATGPLEGPAALQSWRSCSPSAFGSNSTGIGGKPQLQVWAATRTSPVRVPPPMRPIGNFSSWLTTSTAEAPARKALWALRAKGANSPSGLPLRIKARCEPLSLGPLPSPKP
mmetsp:Transcript_31690/g.56925  ORF Transcript_31690/g.56925 Transcript_31690/m.56925 type:complete len:287 (-) Transcript_31690:705-1565(-)